jgi:plasmid stabilization system protein ParE
LTEFPAIGPLRTALGPKARIGIIQPYLIVYDYADGGTVTVLRVLHGRRKITRDLVR